MREHDYPGQLVVVEGADGAGTTTQSKKLADELENSYWTAEPSSNDIGEKITEMISTGGYSPEAVALTFAADRLTHLEEEVIPKLKEGKTVICDRYYHSSFIYQATQGADQEWIKDMNRDAVKPDLTVLMDISADEGLERINGRGGVESIFEELSFQEKVVAGYRELSHELDEDIVLVDATASIETVFRDLQEKVVSKLDL